MTRNPDGSYVVTTSKFAPGAGQGHAEKTTDRWNLRAPGTPVIVNTLEIVPWVYEATRIRTIENISLPNFLSDHVTSAILGVAEDTSDVRPSGVADGDKALRLVNKENDSVIVLWYNPCTLLTDAVKTRTSLLLRIGR